MNKAMRGTIIVVAGGVMVTAGVLSWYPISINSMSDPQPRMGGEPNAQSSGKQLVDTNAASSGALSEVPPGQATANMSNQADLRVVLARLERIERSLNAKETGDASKSEPSQHPIDIHDEMQERIDAQKGVEQRVAMMSNRLISDRASARAGDLAATEREVKIATENNANSRVDNVDCGEALCRLRVTVKDEAAIGEFMVGMIDKLQSWGGGAESHIVGHLPNGNVEVEVFIGRQGHALPPPNS